jgi:hypothetical protein
MCMIDGADEDWVSLGSRMRKARKEHRCYECHRQIVTGETYEAAKGVSDGDIQTFKTCAHCVWARTWIVEQCGGFLYGGVLEDLREHWDESWELRSMDLGRRVILMRDQWVRHGELVPVPG